MGRIPGAPVPMLALLSVFFDIIRCRRGPQDLPVSAALLMLLVLTYGGLTFLQALWSGWKTASAGPLVSVQILMLLAWVWGLLAFFGRRARFLQTMSAVFGILLFLTFIDLALIGFDRTIGIADSVTDAWTLINLFAMVLLIGRVLMIAIEGGLLTGFAFTMMMVLSISYVGQLFAPG